MAGYIEHNGFYSGNQDRERVNEKVLDPNCKIDKAGRPCPSG